MPPCLCAEEIQDRLQDVGGNALCFNRRNSRYMDAIVSLNYGRMWLHQYNTRFPPNRRVCKSRDEQQCGKTGTRPRKRHIGYDKKSGSQCSAQDAANSVFAPLGDVSAGWHALCGLVPLPGQLYAAS
eukprot:415937-Amphidinium_carterae.1